MKTKFTIKRVFVFALVLIGIRANSQNTFPATGPAGIGTTTPAKQLNVHQVAGSNKGILISGDEYYQTGNGDANGILFLSGFNRPGNRQLWIGDNTALGSTTLGFFRYQTGFALPNIDAVTGNGVTRLPVGIGTNTSNVAVGFEYSGATGSTLPASRLSVNGNVAVGNGYIGTVAPSNGLIVQGNVGIGTTNPAYPLHVNGNALFGTQPTSSLFTVAPLNMSNAQFGTLKTQLNLINGGGGGGAGSAIDFYTYTDNGNGLPGARFGSIDDGNFSGHFVFFTKGQGGTGTGSLTEKMRITSNGNVGIGTTNPGTMKLAVEGTIGARKVMVTQTATWPDYVFREEYQLRSLPDLEIYIKKYSHLPDVPSAKEVEKGGLDVGSTQAALLKKIEELTLHVINLNKRIQKLEAVNN